MQKTIDLKNNPEKIIVISENSEVFSFVDLNKQEKFQGFLKIIHDKPNLKSQIKIRAIVDDESFLDLKGIVIVKKHARYTDSDLDMKVLILSKNAIVKALPVVEVFEDEVYAGHGLAISGVPKKELFYLKSRGISGKFAKQIIKEGFLRPENQTFSIPNKT